jgi:hypothetical protein
VITCAAWAAATRCCYRAKTITAVTAGATTTKEACAAFATHAALLIVIPWCMTSSATAM